MAEVIIGNVRGTWWVEIVDGSTILHHERLNPALGLALSALDAFKANPDNSLGNNRWTATNQTEDTWLRTE